MEGTQKVQQKRRVFFYYPNWDNRHTRSVIAGVVDDNTLYVAQASLFPGLKPTLVPFKFRNGATVWIVDPGMKPDHFIKKEGRRIATERAQGFFINNKGEKIVTKRQIIFKLDLPNGEDVNPGKIFVGATENWLTTKGYPPKLPKPRKTVPEPGHVS